MKILQNIKQPSYAVQSARAPKTHIVPIPEFRQEPGHFSFAVPPTKLFKENFNIS